MNQLVWFRNDLRVSDNPALSAALAEGPTIACFCVCEKQWRDHDVGDLRLAFVLRSLQALHAKLDDLNIPLRILATPWFRETPEALLQLAQGLGVDALHFNEEYPLNERRRDEEVTTRLTEAGIRVHRYSGNLTLPPGTVLTQDGQPYTVYTPFRRRWGERLDPNVLESPKAPQRQAKTPCQPDPLPDIADGVPATLGADEWPAGEDHAETTLADFVQARIDRYVGDRDLPATRGTSQLSHHLSVGSISSTACLRAARDANGGRLTGGQPGVDQWINEIVWREFYRHIVARFDHVSKGKAFRENYDALAWRDAPSELLAWQEGRTGYPLVDAAMRCLTATGWMHNRLRMVCAMFLSKHLLIDWRAGERFFMRQLIDGDFASNNGGWQWSASTGTDAAPYFRIFNPASQGKKCDAQGVFVRTWVPELAEVPDRRLFDAPTESATDYPSPIVEHSAARQRALAFFKRDTPSLASRK